MARVVIEDATYENVERVIPKVLERFSIDWDGKRVLVKPNMLGHFNFNENSGSTTHPAVVYAVVKALRNKGAHVIVGDNPGSKLDRAESLGVRILREKDFLGLLEGRIEALFADALQAAHKRSVELAKELGGKHG